MNKIISRTNFIKENLVKKLITSHSILILLIEALR